MRPKHQGSAWSALSADHLVGGTHSANDRSALAEVAGVPAGELPGDGQAQARPGPVPGAHEALDTLSSHPAGGSIWSS